MTDKSIPDALLRIQLNDAIAAMQCAAVLLEHVSKAIQARHPATAHQLAKYAGSIRRDEYDVRQVIDETAWQGTISHGGTAGA